MTHHPDGSGNGLAGNRQLPVEHDDLAGLVAAFADGELPPDTALEVERHLSVCGACRSALRLQRAVRDRLRQESAPPVPAALRDRIATAVTARAGGGDAAGGRQVSSSGKRLALSAAAVLAVVMLGGLLARTGRERETVALAGDTDAIRGLIEAHATAWNRRDARAAVAVLTSDAVWVTADGVELRGKTAIEQAHVQWLAQDSVAGGSIHVHPAETVSIRFLRPDIAVVDVESQFVAPSAVDGPPAVLQRSSTFMVVTRDAGEWRVAQVRNRASSSF
jgi:uncharacterized protein (TIGR02246 family)